jgi:alcohol dehydrogenase (cytochrome c)
MKSPRLFAVLSATAAALVLVAVAGSAQQSPTPPNPMPSVLQRYTPVTAERLKAPQPGDWSMIRRTYDGWGYSPLDQITAANVGRLRRLRVQQTRK